MKVIVWNAESAQRTSDICLGLPTDKKWVVSITEQKEKKSDAQCRTVHGWFRFIAVEYDKATGKYYRPDSWKVYFKERFGVYVEYETLDGIKLEPKSIADYTMAELSVFMEKINNFAGSEFQIYVPIPGEPTEEL